MAGEVQTFYLYAQFYDKDSYASNAQKPFSGAFLSPLAIQFTEEKSQITQISATFSYTPPEVYGTAYKWSDYIQRGRRMTVWVAHTYTSPATQIPIGTFIIDNIEQSKTGDDLHLVVSGPEITQELADKLLYTPIGTYKADLSEMAEAAPAPHTTTLSVTAPANNDALTLTAANWAAVDDEMRLTLDTGHIHVTTIKEVNGNVVTLNQRTPSVATAGKSVIIRKRKIKVDNPELFYEGDIVKIYRNSGGNPPYDGYIIEKIDEETDDITLSHGLLDGANVDNIVMREDYSTPTTNDVSQVLDDAYPDVNWIAEIQAGRTSSTALATRGASAFATLKQIADIHGEYFLAHTLTTVASTMLPQRKLSWHHSCRIPNIDLVQVKTQAEADAAIAADEGVIISFSESIARPPIDTVYVKGAGAGLSQITLANCTAATIAAVQAKYGYTLTGNPGDIYIPYKLVNPALNIKREKLITIDVLPETASPEAIGSAADMMLRQAAAYLYTMSQEAKEYSLRIQCRKRIRAGDRVAISWEGILGDDQFYEKDPFQVISVSMDISTEGMFYDLTVSTSLDPNEAAAPTDENVVSAELIKFIRMREAFDAMPTLGNFRSAVYDGRPIVGGEGAIYIAGDGIAISPTNVMSVDAADLAGYGLETWDNNLRVKLGPTSGLVLESFGLSTVIPPTLSATSVNDRGTGSHAITTTSNAWTNPSTILSGDENGMFGGWYIWAETLEAQVKTVSPILSTTSGNITIDPFSGLVILDGNLQFTGARQITTDTGSLTLAPAQTLYLDPTDNVVVVNPEVTIKTSTAQVGSFPQTGYQFEHSGDIYAKSAMFDELHVAAFIADAFRVKVGGEYIPESMGELAQNFQVPAINSTAYLYVWDVAGFPDIPLFATTDWVLIRVVDSTTGNVFNAWGTVSQYLDQADGSQRWTFRTRSPTLASAVGKWAYAGSVALDYGKSGSGWWYATAMDRGGPHAGIGIWYGNNPTDNPSYMVRLGQLKGVSGRSEYGFQAGLSNSSFVRFSPLAMEIHGARQSMYAGDGAELRVSAASVRHYRDGGVNYSTLLPNADHTILNVKASTGSTYYTLVDEGTGSPNHTDYITNNFNNSGMIFLGLTNPTWQTYTDWVSITVAMTTAGFTNDTVKLYAQVFKSDESTPLTSEMLIYTATTNTTTSQTATFTGHDLTASQTDWNNARLRLRWVYEINNTEETIRFDPNVPSIAVGNPLPTSTQAGGPGVWAGLLSDGTTAVRFGGAYQQGSQFLYTSTGGIQLRDSNADPVVTIDNAGASYFAGRMTIGTNGEIVQGSGTKGNIGAWSGTWGTFTGFRLGNDSGVGKFAGYNSGVAQVYLDSTGKLKAGGGNITLSATGINIYPIAGYSAETAITFQGIGGLDTIFNNEGVSYKEIRLWAGSWNSPSTETASLKFGTDETTPTSAFARLKAGTTILTLASGLDYAGLTGSHFYIREKGLAVGYTPSIAINRGQIASDLAGEHDYNSIVLQDTTDVDHNMPNVLGEATFGALGKYSASTGGLNVIGASESVIGLQLEGVGYSYSNTKGTGSLGAIVLRSRKHNGSGGGGALSTNENLVVIRNNDTTRFIFDAEGDLHSDSSNTTFDVYDDVALAHALNRVLSGHDIDRAHASWVEYNREDLERAGLISGNFTNITRTQRLLTGGLVQVGSAMTKIDERLARLEAKLGLLVDRLSLN